MKSNKLSSFSVASMIFSLSKASFLGLGIPYIFHTAKTSGIFSALLGIVFSVILYAIMLKMFNIMPNETIVGKINKVFPKGLAFIINIVMIMLVLFMSIVLLWRLVSFTSAEFLTETTTLYILILLVAEIGYLTFTNFNVLSRFSVVTLIVTGSILIFNMIGISPFLSLDKLYPMFNDSLMSILDGAIHFSVLFTAPCFLILIFKKSEITNPKKFNKTMWSCFLVSAIALLLIMFFVLCSMGIELIEMYTYPEFVVLKMISVLNFIENVENITTLLWVIYIMIAVSFCWLFIKNTVIEMFKIEKKKSVFITSLSIIFIGTLIVFFMRDYSYYFDKYKLIKLPFYCYLSIIVLVIITMILYYIRKRTTKE